MTETVEQMIQDRGLTAPRLTPTYVEGRIVGETYTVLPSGKVMVCELTLRNGFTVRGEASVVDRANFNEEVGRRISRDNAVRQIWPLEGYLLQQRLYAGGTALLGPVRPDLEAIRKRIEAEMTAFVALKTVAAVNPDPDLHGLVAQMRDRIELLAYVDELEGRHSSVPGPGTPTRDGRV